MSEPKLAWSYKFSGETLSPFTQGHSFGFVWQISCFLLLLFTLSLKVYIGSPLES